MKKYMILALLPVLFQGALYCADINKAIRPELITAQMALKNVNMPLAFDAILPALLLHSKKGSIEKAVAIAHMEDMKVALEKYRSEQYSSWIVQYFYPTPQIIKNQINPAIIKIDQALESLKTSTNNYVYYSTLGGIALFSLALGVLIGPGISDISKSYSQWAAKKAPKRKVDQVYYEATDPDEKLAWDLANEEPSNCWDSEFQKPSKSSASVTTEENDSDEEDASSVSSSLSQRSVVSPTSPISSASPNSNSDSETDDSGLGSRDPWATYQVNGQRCFDEWQ